jgi:hypothetical protein
MNFARLGDCGLAPQQLAAAAGKCSCIFRHTRHPWRQKKSRARMGAAMICHEPIQQ